MRAHHVADRHRRKIRAPRPAKPAPCRIGHFTARPGGAHAAAQHIGADQEVTIRIQRPAGADDILPPAGLARDGVGFGDILITRQRVADQHRIAGRCIEPPIGAIGDREGCHDRAAFQRQPIGKLGGLMIHIGQRGDGLAHKGAFTLPRPPGATFAYVGRALGARRCGGYCFPEDLVPHER